MASVSRRTECRLCGSSDLSLAVGMAATPVAEKYVDAGSMQLSPDKVPLDLYFCGSCSHVQLIDVVNPEYLFDGYTYKSGNTNVLVAHFKEIAEWLVELYGVEPGALVVDIGSNDGSFLECFRRVGMQTLGVDPAIEIAATATANGIETLPEFVTEELSERIVVSHGRAKVVTAFNVFAHADDLGEIVRSATAMLDDDGLFVFEFSYLKDVIEQCLLGTIFHEHLSYHTVRSIEPFLQRNGLSLIDVRHNDIQGGSLVGICQKNSARSVRDPSVDECISQEERAGLHKLDTYSQFSRRLESLKTEVWGIVDICRNDGLVMVGYGAARSGTTLISQLELGKILQFIVDDDPSKQGKCSPGDLIPVKPRTVLLDTQPAYALILAWVHSKKIISSNKSYLEKGGKFISCFPFFEIVSGVHDA